MEWHLEQQILKIFETLFSKENLRKNLYLFQHLNSDMTIKTRTIYQERKIAALCKDHHLLLNCLKKCHLVRVIDNEMVEILAPGDALIVKIWGDKGMASAEIKKMLTPIIKDIKNQMKTTQNNITLTFNSETSALEFVERVKGLNLPLEWQFKEKDPYECIKKSVSFILKQRKAQQEQQPAYNNYTNYSNYNQYGAYYQQPQAQTQEYSYDPSTYNQMYMQAGYGQPYQAYQYPQTQYQTFIRKAVESSDEDEATLEGESGKVKDKDFPVL